MITILEVSYCSNGFCNSNDTFSIVSKNIKNNTFIDSNELLVLSLGINKE